MNKKPGAGMSDRARWALITAEVAASYALIFISAINDWPGHEYFRFFPLLPIYQAATAYGYSGGIVTSVGVSLIFILVMPLDRAIWNQEYGRLSAAVMMGVITFFGVLVGGIIGAAGKSRERLDRLSETFLEIARGEDEREVMERLLAQSLNFFEARAAAAMIAESDGQSAGEVLYLEAGADKTEKGGRIPDGHPLAWAVAHKAWMVTSSVPSDARFVSTEKTAAPRSLLVAPVYFDGRVYGSLLLMEKKSGDKFTVKDAEAAVMFCSTAASAIHSMEEERNRQEQRLREERMKDLFSRFVSSSVADYVLEHPDVLAGRRQQVSLLVSDIRDFTTISEALSPRELVAQLNEYFSRMVDIVFEHGGTIDKFVGDCIIAYWGAPAPDPGHAGHALDAAAAMAAAQDALNAAWAAEGRPVFRTGIALHTCQVLIGNVGDDRKKAFTVLGEGVDSAMALEAATKKYGVRMLLSGPAAAAAGPGRRLKKLPDGEMFGGLFTTEE